MSASRATCVSFAFAFILPLFSLLIGWFGWGFQAGVVAALVTFVVFLMIGGVSLAFIKDLSWMMISLPFLAGIVYMVAPDLLPFLPFDDAAVLFAGSLASFALAIRKEPTLPRWLFVPLMAGSIYTLFGAIIPGPIDELLVLLIGTGVTALKAQQSLNQTRNESTPLIIDQTVLKDDHAIQLDGTKRLLPPQQSSLE